MYLFIVSFSPQTPGNDVSFLHSKHISFLNFSTFHEIVKQASTYLLVQRLQQFTYLEFLWFVGGTVFNAVKFAMCLLIFCSFFFCLFWQGLSLRVKPQQCFLGSGWLYGRFGWIFFSNQTRRTNLCTHGPHLCPVILWMCTPSFPLKTPLARVKEGLL